MAQVKDILQKSLSSTTWSQYAKIWNDFECFSRTVLETPAALPVLPFQVIMFLASLHQKGLAASNIRSSGSAISFLHKLRGMPNPMTSFLVAKFLHGLSNANASQDVRLPITRPILHRMLKALSVIGFSLYKSTLLRAFYLTMFHAFLRIGEATSKSPASSPIQYTDLVIDTQGAAIRLNQFKHSNVPHRVELQRGNDPVVCPVKALEDFTFLRGGAEGSLFSTPAGRPYTATAAREDLSSVLSFCGLDNKRYKSHSFRIGAASDAALRGFSDAQIRLMGRWHSDAFRQYIRLPY